MGKMTLWPVVVQDARTNDVLMVAWANREALRRTRRTRLVHLFSRSRNRLWRKGATSGNVMRVVSIHRDCDRDAFLVRAEPAGPACHRGTYSCFSNRPLGSAGFLPHLSAVIRDRRRRPRRGSYTSRLLKDRSLRIRKLLEEAGELAVATIGGRRTEIVSEAADLLYHLLVILEGSRVRLEDVEGELRRRAARARGSAGTPVRANRCP